MKRRWLWCAAAALLVAGPVIAKPAPLALRVTQAWIRWLPVNLPAAGYAVIVNDGNAPVQLVAADSPDYKMVSLHRSLLKEGSSAMVAVPSVNIPAHGQLPLEPGGYHLMLMNATRSIKPGDTVKITLRFADGALLQADFPVRPADASGP